MKSLRFVVLSLLFLSLVGVCFAETPYFNSIETAKELSGCSKESFVLMSHNAGNFGKSKSDAVISVMAQIYRDADIVVLLEVSTSNAGAQAVARLADELNRRGSAWDYAISDPTGGSGTERYAFLWKKKRIYLKSVGKKINLFETYRNNMVRIPAKATFHLDFGIDDQEENLLEVICAHLAPLNKQPKNEIELFAEFDSGYFDSENQVFVGDFNLSHRQIDFVLEDELGFNHQIEGKTSLKDKTDKMDGNYYSKEYDNIYTKGFVDVIQAGIIDFVPEVKDLSKAKKISDHLPVFIIFNKAKNN